VDEIGGNTIHAGSVSVSKEQLTVKASGKVTLYASLIGSAVGTGAWFLGIGKWIWPGHPQLAAFLLTIVTTVVLMQSWPDDSGAKRPSK
jgi:hypothetical protein